MRFSNCSVCFYICTLVETFKDVAKNKHPLPARQWTWPVKCIFRGGTQSNRKSARAYFSLLVLGNDVTLLEQGLGSESRSGNSVPQLCVSEKWPLLSYGPEPICSENRKAGSFELSSGTSVWKVKKNCNYPYRPFSSVIKLVVNPRHLMLCSLC